jgi:hypothetical protein
LGGFSSCIDYIIPPPPPPRKTKAQREAEEAAAEENRITREKEAQKRAEAARLKREEEERIAAENAAEAAKKVEEEKKYIAENTKTTYLACPSLAREGELEWDLESGDYVQTTFGPPKRYAYIELNKVEGDNPDLNGYITSTAYWDIARVGVKSTRYSACRPAYDAFTQEIWPESWCLGEYSTAKVSEGNYGFKGPLYGRKILEWPQVNPIISSPDSSRFIIDKVTLIATSDFLDEDRYRSRETQYQCEVVTKDTFDEKIQEAKTRVQAAVDGYKAEKAAEEAARKAEEPQI